MNTGFAITTGSMFATITSVANINWHGMFVAIFALAACAMAVAVVLTDNVVRMAFYLVLSLGATAGLFFLAGAEFVGAMQLMIYVGGTLVLLVFGVMLTAQAPFVSMKTPQRDWVLASILAICLLAVLVQASGGVDAWRTAAVSVGGGVQREAPEPSATPLGMALLGMRVDNDSSGIVTPSIRSGYLLPFEIVSIHLLVVLVGAAYLARAKRRRTPRAVETAGQSESKEEVRVAS